MAGASYVQTNFQGGEWAPSHQGRMEDPRYKIALSQCLNYIPTMEGGLQPRSGFQYIGHTAFGAVARLKDVKFSQSEAYVAEVSGGNDGQKTFTRFWANGLLLTYGDTDRQHITDVVSTGGKLVFTTAQPFDDSWDTTYTLVKIKFTTIADMLCAPTLIDREFFLIKTGADTCTLQDPLTNADINDTITGTFSAYFYRVFQDVIAGPPGLFYRALPFAVQNINLDGSYSSPDQRVAFLSDIQVPISFSGLRGITAGSIIEKLIDGPYHNSFGNTPLMITNGVGAPITGLITVCIRGFSNATQYMRGDIAIDGGYGGASEDAYICLKDNSKGNFGTPANSDWSRLPKAWDSTVTYSLGISVRGAALTTGSYTPMFSLADSNTNHAVTNPTWWDSTPPAWVSGTTYALNAIVQDSSINYVCIAPTSGVTAPASDTTHWAVCPDLDDALDQMFNTTTGWMRPDGPHFNLADGANYTYSYEKVGRLIRMKGGPQPWDVQSTYAIGARVNYNDVLFTSLTNGNVGNQPDVNTTNWQLEEKEIVWSWGEIQDVSTTTKWTYPFQATVLIKGDDLPTESGIYSDWDAIHEFRLGVYANGIGWPTCGTYYEGRVGIAGDVVPNRVDFGQPDRGFVFAPTEKNGTVTDANGIAMVLNAGDLENIHNLNSSNDGVTVFTDSAEWQIAASNLNDPLTPTSAQAHRNTTFTSAKVDNEDIPTGTAIIQGGKRKRLFEYRQFADTSSWAASKNAVDLTRTCQHLTVNGISKTTYQRIPQPVIWCAAGNLQPPYSDHDLGHDLFGLGFMKDPEVQYCAPFSIEHGITNVTGIGRNFFDILAQYGTTYTALDLFDVPGPLDADQFLYVTGSNLWTDAVYRPQPVMEMMHPVLDTSGDAYDDIDGSTDKVRAFGYLSGSLFLDSAVKPLGAQIALDGLSVTFYGMYYFAGVEVSFTIRGKYLGEVTIAADGSINIPFTADFTLADIGYALVPLTVTTDPPRIFQSFLLDKNGNTFTTPSSYESINAWFGYKYKRRGQMLRPIVGSQNGPAFAKVTRNHRAGIYVDAAHEISAGTTFGTTSDGQSGLVPITLTVDGPRDETALAVGEVTTGIYREFIKDDYSFDGKICWEQTEPYPGGILSIGGFDAVEDV